MGAGWYPPDHPKHVPGLGFNTHADRATKNNGGSWFAVAHNTTSGKGQNPDGRKLPGFRFDGSGRSFQTASVEGIKNKDADGYERTHPNNFGWNSPPTSSGAKKARKAASAMIAKIPLPLSRHIARSYYLQAEAA